MKYLLFVLFAVTLFSCRKDIQIERPVEGKTISKPSEPTSDTVFLITSGWLVIGTSFSEGQHGLYKIKWVDDTEQREAIGTLYAWSHVWIGTSKWIDSAYGEFLAKEGQYFMTRHERMRRLAKDVIK